MEATCNDASNAAAVEHSSPVMSFNGKRLIMDEMDFFPHNNSTPVNDQIHLHVDFVALVAELHHMNAENQRLRELIDRVNNDYNALHMQLMKLMQKNSINMNRMRLMKEPQGRRDKRDEGKLREKSMVDLMECKTDQKICTSRDIGQLDLPEKLDSDCKDGAKSRRDHEESPTHKAFPGSLSNEVTRLSSSFRDNVDQASETMSMIKKARVSVRARSESSMISDGCQWRKYGQKMAKEIHVLELIIVVQWGLVVQFGNKYRGAEDRSVLVTTYEGQHNHPLPPTAKAMASTTSAAASMLLSGSMPSADGLINPSILESAALPCSQNMATLSASAPFPTITLDLTQNATNSSQPQGGPQGQLSLLPPLLAQKFMSTPNFWAGNGDSFIYRHSKCSNSCYHCRSKIHSSSCGCHNIYHWKFKSK
ncbi:WRKY domain [Sesbania bispinosa]|nr:WRKY domain [Sesbania bispinosa]